MRIDQLLVQQGLAASRSQAQRLIAAGVSWLLSEPAGNPWRAIRKSGDDVPESAELQLTDDSEGRYVSRGGLKLAGALATTGVVAQGKLCLDVGQSTGGFTDCLLQAGAAHVVGVDVGHGQVHPRIQAHPQVSCVQRVNARDLTLEQLQGELQGSNPFDDSDSIANNSLFDGDEDPLESRFSENAKNVAINSMLESDRGIFDCENGAPFALIVGDLSFISQTLVLPALVPMLADGGDLLMLVKPQFELQPQDIGKGGLVRDPAAYAQVEERLRTTCASLGLQVVRWFDSPISGGDGNREFFMHARHAQPASQG